MYKEIPNQEDKRCELCGRTHEKELIHILHLDGKVNKKKIEMCDVCIVILRDEIEGY